MLAMIWAAAALGQAESAAGRWITETRHGIVEIMPCGTAICGRLVDSDSIRADPQARDKNNKDPAQRQRLLKGLPMLWGFTGRARQWEGGSVYNPDDGGTYHGTVTIVDANTLKVRGCIIWPLCKAQVWKRVG